MVGAVAALDEPSTVEGHDPFRSVTAEEIAHYREFGWVKLSKFLPPGRIRAALDYAKGKMGEDATITIDPKKKFPFFNRLSIRDIDSPIFGPIVRHYGAAAYELSPRKNIGFQCYNDSFSVKLPHDPNEGHGRSDWHQDFAAITMDRSGAMVFWTALVDMPVEMGTMAFLNRSHREGVMGDFRTYGDGNLLDNFPDLIGQCPSSGYLEMAAGDVTVHSDLCVHSAGPNQTSDPRWTYIMQLVPTDAKWTGAPAISFDNSWLSHLQPLDEARFPRVG